MRRATALVLILVSVVAVGWWGAPLMAKERKPSRGSLKAEDLMNPLLAPRYALWLLGPISRLATKDEIDSYVRLGSDAEAEAFIEGFWARRDPDPQYEGNSLRERFDERVKLADRSFAEAGVPGRQTDRGTTFVLHGPPAEERFDIAEHPDDPPVLVWTYPADAPKGLDGKPPDRVVRFIKRGDLTQFFSPNLKPPKPRPGRPGPP